MKFWEIATKPNEKWWSHKFEEKTKHLEKDKKTRNNEITTNILLTCLDNWSIPHTAIHTTSHHTDIGFHFIFFFVFFLDLFWFISQKPISQLYACLMFMFGFSQKPVEFGFFVSVSLCLLSVEMRNSIEEYRTLDWMLNGITFIRQY